MTSRFAPSPGSRARSRAGMLAMFLVLAPLAVLAAGCGGTKAKRSMRVPVSTALAVRQSVPDEMAATGQVEPYRTVSVYSQVGGLITQVSIHEGDEVRRGQVMFRIDPRPLQAELAQANAVLARDRAQWNTAQRQALRSQELFEQKLIAAEENDTKRSAAEALRAAVLADSAAAQSARLALANATIVAPMAGRTGSIGVHPGSLVKANDTGAPLVVVNQMRPILVRFTVPERVLASVRREGVPPLTVYAVPASGDSAIAGGRLTFVDNAVDPTTGTVLLKAEFANQNEALWPGAFAGVRLILGETAGACVIPADAVSEGQRGSFVYVVGADTTVTLRPVTVARTHENLAVIAVGVTPGERVVTDGQLRLSPGAKVVLRDAGARRASAGSAPAESVTTAIP